MKIIYFSSSTLPSQAANSIHVMHMCEAFGQLGHETSLVYARSPESIDDQQIFEKYGVAASFSLCAVSRPSMRYIGLILYSLLGFLKYVLGSKADLVYCRDFLGALLSAKAGYKTVFELHSLPDSALSRMCFERIYRSNGLFKVVVISEALQRDVEYLYPDLRDRIIVAHDAASDNSVTLSDVKTHRDQRLQVGYVGSLYHGKGIDLIIQLARLAPEADFQIIGGSGPLLEKWKKETKELSNVIFHGFKPHAEIARYIAGFDVVLLPNQKIVHIYGRDTDIARWTSPLKMFEYMAAGKAIISSDLPVLKEVMVANHNCLLCDPEDSEAWRQALEHLSLNPELRSRLGNQAKSDFIAHYTWHKRAERLLRVTDASNA